MGIRLTCPSGHKLHVKTFLAGKRGVCPHCGAKFEIPALHDLQQATEPPPPDGSPPTPVEAFSSSASIIISTADDPTQPAAPADHDAPRLADSFAPATTAEPAAAPAQPAPVAATAEVESPAVRHVSRRERARRKQFKLAILLLIAVILLALILIWVVRRGNDASPAGALSHRLIPRRAFASIPLQKFGCLKSRSRLPSGTLAKSQVTWIRRGPFRQKGPTKTFETHPNDSCAVNELWERSPTAIIGVRDASHTNHWQCSYQ